jgi:chromosome partitioning protein
LNRGRQRPSVAFDLVAGDDHLFEFTLDIRSEAEKTIASQRFGELVGALRLQYDVIVLDVNPCATFLTRCAIGAANHIVAPVRPEKYSLTGLNMLEQITRYVRGRDVTAAEFSVLLNGVGDRARARGGHDVDAETRAEIGGAPFFGSALLTHAIPYTGLLRATPADRYTANPINVTAMLRMAQRDLKESLTGAAAEIMRRASA